MEAKLREALPTRLRQACMKAEAGFVMGDADLFLMEEAYKRIEELEAALSTLPRMTEELTKVLETDKNLFKELVGYKNDDLTRWHVCVAVARLPHIEKE